jgi:D-alanine-D-alanine ligase-like ATP-grasp enzyme
VLTTSASSPTAPWRWYARVHELMAHRRPTALTRALAWIGEMGRPGRVLAPQLDRMRMLGPGARSGSAWNPGEAVAKTLARSQAEVYRRIWGEAAETLGAELRPLAGGYLLAMKDGVQTVVMRHLVMIDHPVTEALALDKPVVHRALAERGLAVGEHLEVDRGDRDAAVRFLEGSRARCVVKPASGTSGGEGVTCGVEDVDDLWRAWLHAARWDRRILIEREARGEEYRLLFLDGALIGAVRRGRPQVSGDAASSVLQLIEAENDRRLRAGSSDVARLIRVDLDCELAVRTSGLSLDAVAASGRRVTVKNTVGENAAADNVTVSLDDVSTELQQEAASAVRALHLELAGIDLVTTDLGRSLRETGGVILEVNATPGLHYHYQVADPSHATPVAVPILRRLLAPVTASQQ